MSSTYINIFNPLLYGFYIDKNIIINDHYDPNIPNPSPNNIYQVTLHNNQNIIVLNCLDTLLPEHIWVVPTIFKRYYFNINLNYYPSTLIKNFGTISYNYKQTFINQFNVTNMDKHNIKIVMDCPIELYIKYRVINSFEDLSGLKIELTNNIKNYPDIPLFYDTQFDINDPTICGRINYFNCNLEIPNMLVDLNQIWSFEINKKIYPLTIRNVETIINTQLNLEKVFYNTNCISDSDYQELYMNIFKFCPIGNKEDWKYTLAKQVSLKELLTNKFIVLPIGFYLITFGYDIQYLILRNAPRIGTLDNVLTWNINFCVENLMSCIISENKSISNELDKEINYPYPIIKGNDITTNSIDKTYEIKLNTLNLEDNTFFTIYNYIEDVNEIRQLIHKKIYTHHIYTFTYNLDSNFPFYYQVYIKLTNRFKETKIIAGLINNSDSYEELYITFDTYGFQYRSELSYEISFKVLNSLPINISDSYNRSQLKTSINSNVNYIINIYNLKIYEGFKRLNLITCSTNICPYLSINQTRSYDKYLNLQWPELEFLSEFEEQSYSNNFIDGEIPGQGKYQAIEQTLPVFIGTGEGDVENNMTLEAKDKLYQMLILSQSYFKNKRLPNSNIIIPSLIYISIINIFYWGYVKDSISTSLEDSNPKFEITIHIPEGKGYQFDSYYPTITIDGPQFNKSSCNSNLYGTFTLIHQNDPITSIDKGEGPITVTIFNTKNSTSLKFQNSLNIHYDDELIIDSYNKRVFLNKNEITKFNEFWIDELLIYQDFELVAYINDKKAKWSSPITGFVDVYRKLKEGIING